MTIWQCENVTRSRRRYMRHGMGRYVLDNTNDDHDADDREDYSVALDGTTPPAAGFENTEQTASCDPGYSGDDVVVAAGEYGAATQEAADALALAAATAGLVCVLDTEDTGEPVEEWDPYDIPEQGAFSGYFEDIAVYGDLVAVGCTSTYASSIGPLYAFGANSAELMRQYTSAGIPMGGLGGDKPNRLAFQSDGKLLAAYFTGESTNGVKRFNTDGSLDGTFSLTWNRFQGEPGMIKVLDDDKIIVACNSHNSTPYIRLFLADGSADPTFTPPDLTLLNFFEMFDAAVDSSGRIYVAGYFPDGSIVGVPSMVVRFLANGTLDVSFVVEAPAVGFQLATSIFIDESDVITMAGLFSSVNGTARNNMVRINTSGVVDVSYNPNVNGGISRAVLQPDGKIVIAGGGPHVNDDAFTTVGGITVGTNLARINTDGSLDESFDHGLNFTSGVNALALHDDGRIFLTGGFTEAQVARVHLARLSSDGTLA